jgi:ABC-type hemin transport system substrate-binding protein
LALLPSATEIVYALGLGERLFAATRSSDLRRTLDAHKATAEAQHRDRVGR